MRIVASIQSKRGSSRGLVHYIAHSKIDPLSERGNVRELFNDRTNILSVENANNLLKIGLSKNRPGNDELHHFVISFRETDYRKLGHEEKLRDAAIRDITRAGLDALKEHLKADGLSWVAAVHLNTDNPHVHIALQKEYFSNSLDKCYLSKIPQEMMPHYQIVNNERILILGLLISAAEHKMELIQAQEHIKERTSQPSQILHGEAPFDQAEKDRSNLLKTQRTLGKAIIGEVAIRQIDLKIDQLIQNGDKMRFLVTDSLSGEKRRLSIHDLDQRRSTQSVAGSVDDSSERKVIKTILLKMLGKQESQRVKAEETFRGSIEEAKQLRAQHRKENLKLPTPLFSKSEIDRLQEQCLETSDVRRFAYLERVRTELQKKGEIEGRDNYDLRRVFAHKALRDLRYKSAEKALHEFDAGRFYKRVDLAGKSISLADVARTQEKPGFISKFVEDFRKAASRFTRSNPSIEDTNRDQLRQTIEGKLEGSKQRTVEERSSANKQSKLLEKILGSEQQTAAPNWTYNTLELDEIERLAFTLNSRVNYEQNWHAQRSFIESAGADCSVAKKLSKSGCENDLDGHKQKTIGGRAIAKEIIAMIHVNKAKEELENFKRTKHYHKFPVTDLRNKEVNYLSLNDVGLPRTHSILDQAVNLMLEGKEHRRNRKAVTGMVNEKEAQLKSEYLGAKEILSASSIIAFEFKKLSLLSLRSEPSFVPIYTPSEISLIEFRINQTRNYKEAANLKTILKEVDTRSAQSTANLLKTFESSGRTLEITRQQHPQQANSEGRDVQPTRTEHGILR